jgi:hypothetical protein
MNQRMSGTRDDIARQNFPLPSKTDGIIGESQSLAGMDAPPVDNSLFRRVDCRHLS